MIKFKNVSKVINGKSIIKDISFHVEPGEMVVFIGSSGCGKTTTLRMINRLIEPTDGKILIREQDNREIDPIQLRLGIGYVIQKVGLIPHMTISENIDIIPHLKGWDKKQRQRRVHELLELVNLEPQEFATKRPYQLSGGQQQRVGIARALGADPDIILLDEPFSALDPINKQQLQIELKKLQKLLGKTCVMVSHDMNEALLLGDRIIFMHAGHIEQIGTPHDFLTNPANERVSSFFNQASHLKHSHIIQAKDIASFVFPKISIHEKLQEAANIFEETEEEFVIVTDETDHYKGYITARELNRYSFDSILETVPLRKKNTLSASASTEDVLKLFQSDKNLNFIPVENETLIGIITRQGLLNYIVSTIDKERNHYV